LKIQWRLNQILLKKNNSNGNVVINPQVVIPNVLPPVEEHSYPILPTAILPQIPVSPVVEEKRVNPQVQALLEMGFVNPERIEKLLEKNAYDLPSTVQDLLNS